MTFAVFGRNIDRAKTKAFDEIAELETKNFVRRRELAENLDTQLGKHCANLEAGIQDQAQYQAAFNEVFGKYYRRLRRSQISPEYDTLAASKKFLELISKSDSTAIIKQKIGNKFAKEAFNG